MIEKVDINIENGLSCHEVNERIKEGRVNRLNKKKFKII